VVVFRNSTCLVKIVGDTPACVSSDDPDNRLVSVSEDSFAASRKTAMAVNDAKYLPADAVEHAGLVNKFPFDTAKRTYQYWESLIGDTVDAKYIGTDKVQGVETYKFQIDVSDVPAEISNGIQGTYSTQKTIWVEPVTGSILNQTEKQVRLAEDGSNVLDLTLDMTPESSKQLADDAKANKQLLSIVGTWVPIGGLVLGLVTLLGGLVMMRGVRRYALAA
jgi:hypothetical protein